MSVLELSLLMNRNNIIRIYDTKCDDVVAIRERMEALRSVLDGAVASGSSKNKQWKFDWFRKSYFEIGYVDVLKSLCVCIYGIELYS